MSKIKKRKKKLALVDIASFRKVKCVVTLESKGICEILLEIKVKLISLFGKLVVV